MHPARAFRNSGLAWPGEGLKGKPATESLSTQAGGAALGASTLFPCLHSVSAFTALHSILCVMRLFPPGVPGAGLPLSFRCPQAASALLQLLPDEFRAGKKDIGIISLVLFETAH